MSRLDLLHERLAPLRSALLDHPLYRHISGIAALRLFMGHHVFAVWDFMSLLKSLQRRFSCVEVPWLPSADPAVCRMVNEIVLAEESDDDGEGGYASHFDLYRRAMTRCGADTATVDAFLRELRRGRRVADALETAPAPARNFVAHTFALIDSGDVCAIASAFAFGREELLPGVFRRVVEALDAETGGTLADFRYYLNRHIGLDEDEHGPMAGRLVAQLCGDDEGRWASAERAAVSSLEARLGLWDGVLAAVTAGSLRAS